jgi:hypothetical protein
MYYSGRICTYRLDRTTVTVGVPRILAMSTNPTSAGASSWASIAAAVNTKIWYRKESDLWAQFGGKIRPE